MPEMKILRPVWIIKYDKEISAKKQAKKIICKYKKVYIKPKKILINDTRFGLLLCLKLQKEGLPVKTEGLVYI